MNKYIMTFLILQACISVAVTVIAADGTALQAQEQTQTVSQAQVDPDETPALLQAMQQYRFTQSHVLHVQNMVQEAQKQGIPTDPLIDKVYEGMAKKINEEKIIQAANRVQHRYENAYRNAAELTENQEEINTLGTVIAEAQTAGLGDQDRDRIMTQLQKRIRKMDKIQAYALSESTFLAVRNMSRHGAGSAAASEVVVNALQHSFQAREMKQLQESFTTQARFGHSEEVARSFSYQISRGTDAAGLGTGSGRGGGTAAGSEGSDSDSGGGSGAGSSGSGGSDSGSGGGSGAGSSGSGGSDSGSGGGSGAGSGGSGSSDGGSGDGSGAGSGGSGGSDSGSGAGSGSSGGGR